MRRNMTESEYRPEQLFVRDFLADTHPFWKVRSEYKVRGLKIDGKPYRKCILDIAIPKDKIAIRLNGGYHFASDRQRIKDEFQKDALEQAGWKVYDFDDHKMPNLFKKKKKVETIKLAKEEILRYLG